MATYNQSYFPSLEMILPVILQQFFPFFYGQPPPLSFCSKESFPGAKKAFVEAYSLSDPTRALLSLIKACPTEAAVEDLLFYYMDAAEENPSRAFALTSVLVALRDSPEAPLFRMVPSFRKVLASL